jgi:hypothetical protein
MAHVESWIEGHEKRCAERQVATLEGIGELKGIVRGWRAAAWSLVIALLAWAMIQIWSTTEREIAEARAAHETVQQHS